MKMAMRVFNSGWALLALFQIWAVEIGSFAAKALQNNIVLPKKSRIHSL